MTRKKAFTVIVFSSNQTFFGFLNLSGNLMYLLSDNGLYLKILIHTPSIDSIIQADSLLMKLSIIYRIS